MTDSAYFRKRLEEIREGVRQVRRRRFFCRKGHGALHISPSGQTRCRVCERLRSRRRRAARPPAPPSEMVAFDGTFAAWEPRYE